MNYSIIRYIVGLTLILEGALMLPSCIVAVIYREPALWALGISVLGCFAFGLLLRGRKPENTEFFAREGFVAVALCWLAISVMGAVPFVLSGAIPDPVQALFESVSGFTTTGASILPAVEPLPKSILFWRSFTHWIGGMGVLVFLLTILPMNGGFHMSLMKAESPGPSVSRLVPKVQTTAKILYLIYIGMTVLQICLLLLGRMPLFDALTLSFGTAGTGGFGVRNDSIAGYSVYNQVVITIFMILFGVNFNAYFFILFHRASAAFKMEEVRAYLGIILAAILIVTFNVWHYGMFDSLSKAFQQAAFQVASIITTTGYSTVDFNVWPEMSRTMLVMIMFVGACSGSTGGGIKVSRIVILFRTIRKEIWTFVHPDGVMKVRVDGKSVDHEVVRATNVFFAAYFAVFAISVLLLSIDNLDSVTNFTAVAATINNIGPGLSLVGPATNYSVYSARSLLVMIFDMLAGRLELFPLLVLLSRRTWRKF